MNLANKTILSVLVTSVFSIAFASECDSELIKNQLQLAGIVAKSEIDSLRNSTILASLHWVNYQDEMRQLDQSAQRLKNIEDEKTREQIGFTVIQGLSSVDRRFPLTSCIDREISLKDGEKSLFPGFTFVVSEKTEAVPYIIKRESGDNQVSIRTANSVYMFNSRSKQIWVFSKKEDKFVTVDANSSRWVSNIIQKHNL